MRLPMPDIKKIEKFFFEAMLHGWISKGSANKVKISQNETVFTFANDNLFLTDRYWTSPTSDRSAGITLIQADTVSVRANAVPVWVMQYQGRYSKDAIPLLKKVLLGAYEVRAFWGARGQPYFKKGSLIYLNHIKINEFGFFRGSEEIICTSGAQLGYHAYMGMSLI